MNASTTDPLQHPSFVLLGAEPFRAMFELARHHLAREAILVGWSPGRWYAREIDKLIVD